MVVCSMVSTYSMVGGVLTCGPPVVESSAVVVVDRVLVDGGAVAACGLVVVV